MKTLKNILLITTVLVLLGCDQKTAAVAKLDESKIKVGIVVSDSPRIVPRSANFKVTTKIFNTGEITIPSLGKDGDLLKVGLPIIGKTWTNLSLFRTVL